MKHAPRLSPLLLALLPASAAGLQSNPCGVPMPGAGQTVTWTAAGGPYVICQDLTIPAGGTVQVEAGASVVVDPSRTLSVAGRLELMGTVAQDVILTGSGGGRLNVSGTVEGGFAQISVPVIEQASGGAIVLADSDLLPASSLVLDTPFDAPIVLRLDRCTVASQTFNATGQAALRDVTFTGTSLELTGYTLLDGVVSSAPLYLYADFQTQHVDDVSVSGVAGPAIVFQRSDIEGGANLFVGPNVDLSGNGYPLHLQGQGLEPGSQLPATGNLTNAILGPTNNWVYGGDVDWPDVGLPYHVTGDPRFSALRIHPGVHVQMGPSANLTLDADSFQQGPKLRGLPGQPIRFDALEPALGWYALAGGFGSYLFEYLEVEGAGVGVSAPQATIFLKESVIQGCDVGVAPSGLGWIEASGTSFLNNVSGAQTDPSAVSATGLDFSGFGRPNTFAGNGLAIENITPNSQVTDARGNWWNHASGPFHAAGNPGGQGDPVDSKVDFSGWLSSAPDLSDAPPTVRIETPYFLAEPGSKVLLFWDASDDGVIVSQTILLDATGGGAPDFQPVATNLPGVTRSYEWTVPDIGFHTAARPVVLRIEALDDAGNTSFDQVYLQVPENLPAGSFVFTAGDSGPYEPDQKIDLCWTATGLTSGWLRSYLVLDADEVRSRGPEGTAGSWCAVSGERMPDVSTDCARWAVVSEGNGNMDEWYFSEPFAIRPSPLLGDAPPTRSNDLADRGPGLCRRVDGADRLERLGRRVRARGQDPGVDRRRTRLANGGFEICRVPRAPTTGPCPRARASATCACG